jgi:hypothetical protein
MSDSKARRLAAPRTVRRNDRPHIVSIRETAAGCEPGVGRAIARVGSIDAFSECYLG